MASEQAKTKKFQKGERTIAPASERADKYYPAEDVSAPKKVRNTQLCHIRRNKHGKSRRGCKEFRSTALWIRIVLKFKGVWVSGRI